MICLLQEPVRGAHVLPVEIGRQETKGDASRFRELGPDVVCDNYFFFSSRRRHTRCSRDWSSDVCSSDLMKIFLHTIVLFLSFGLAFVWEQTSLADYTIQGLAGLVLLYLLFAFIRKKRNQIGRASCRERV